MKCVKQDYVRRKNLISNNRDVRLSQKIHIDKSCYRQQPVVIEFSGCFSEADFEHPQSDRPKLQTKS
jgi:hypothetical protein